VSLRDDAIAAQQLPGPTCAVQRAIRAHPTLADELIGAISDRTVPASGLEIATRQHGIDGINRFTIERHRHNQCQNCRKAGRTY